MRSKHFIGALAGVLAVAFAAVAVASPQFKQHADVKLTPAKGKGKPKAGTSVGINAHSFFTDPGAPDGNTPSATKIVIKLPKGTRSDTTAVKQCTKDDAGVQNGDCPNASKIGAGEAKANAYNRTAHSTLALDVPEKVTVYNGKKEIILLLTPENALGQTLVLHGKLTKKGVLTVKVPNLVVFGAQVILSDLNVKIKARNNHKKGKKRKNLLTAPTVCTKKGWTTVVTYTHDQGAATQVVRSKTKCKK